MDVLRAVRSTVQLAIIYQGRILALISRIINGKKGAKGLLILTKIVCEDFLLLLKNRFISGGFSSIKIPNEGIMTDRKDDSCKDMDNYVQMIHTQSLALETLLNQIGF